MAPATRATYLPNQLLRELLRIPSVTGREAEAQRWLAQQMQKAGLKADLWTIDVEQLHRRADFPDMEVERAGHKAVGPVEQASV